MPTGTLPEAGKKLFEEVYDERLKTCQDKGGSKDTCQESAARQAWSVVKNAGWSKDESGNWHKSADLQEFSLRIERASFDKASGEMRWRAVASDVADDGFNDNMTSELFADFLARIHSGEQVPEKYRSEFWSGGVPYLSVSHYPDLNGKGIPGPVNSVYMDGNYLKAKGIFSDTPLGRACFKSVCADLYDEKSKVRDDKVRMSIGFLDYKHRHKSNGYVFERQNIDDICIECIREKLTGNSSGKEFLKGHLVHLAMTRVPVNRRTDMEVEKSMAIKTRKDDAVSIVGEEEAEKLEQEAKLVGKSEALVIKSDGQMTEEEMAKECMDENGKVDEDCMARMKEKQQQKSETMAEEDVVDELDDEEEKSEAVVEEAAMKTEQGKKRPASDYLVVEDSDKPSTWHLPVKVNGKPDHNLMRSARAALTSNFRGHSYQGPQKAQALAKLKRLYSSEGMDWESKSEVDLLYDLGSELSELRAEFDNVYQPDASDKRVEEETQPVHILDASFNEFKAQFDAVYQSEALYEEKVQAMTGHFNAFGKAISEFLKDKRTEPESLVELSRAVVQLSQQVALISAQLKGSMPAPTNSETPVRRSIAESIVQQVPKPGQSVIQSGRPMKIGEIVNLTT